MTPLLHAVEITKSFGGSQVLRGVSLEVHRGETVCIVGPSGAGKSTFLRCMNALETPDSGGVLLDGELLGYRRKGDKLVQLPEAEMSRQRRRTAMVFQHFNLFPHLTALENIALAPHCVAGMSKASANKRAMDALEKVGLASKANSFPEALSGGQQQRVGIARALAMDPEVMLLDEPTSALDPELVNEVLSTIRAVQATGATSVIVTHEISFARDVADLVVVMVDGEVIEQGPPAQVLDTPKTERTQRFLRHVRGQE